MTPESRIKELETELQLWKDKFNQYNFYSVSIRQNEELIALYGMVGQFVGALDYYAQGYGEEYPRWGTRAEKALTAYENFLKQRREWDE